MCIRYTYVYTRTCIHVCVHAYMYVILRLRRPPRLGGQRGGGGGGQEGDGGQGKGGAEKAGNIQGRRAEGGGGWEMNAKTELTPNTPGPAASAEKQSVICGPDSSGTTTTVRNSSCHVQ